MRFSGRRFTLLAVVAAMAVVCAAAAPRTNLQEILKLAAGGKLDAAYLLANRSAEAHQDNSELATVRAILRQRAVLAHLQRAHALVAAGKRGEAALQFRTALAFDPTNADARRGLAAQYAVPAAPAPDSTRMRVKRAAPPIAIAPTPGRHAFHLRTSLRQGVAQIAATFGLSAEVANDVPQGQLHLDVADADFAQTMAALRAVSGLAWIPLDRHTLYFGAASELQKLEPYATRTFYLPWVADGVTLNQITNVVRSLLGIRNATPDVTDMALTLRATPAQLDAAEKLLLDMRTVPGEVVLHIQILELNATTAHALGVGIPGQFTMFSLGPLLDQLQQSGGLSQDILNLFQQGGLNAVLNSGELSAGALSQAQATLSPLLQNPFVVFGGGATLMALSVPQLAAKFSANQGRVSTLESALLRAGSGQAAELKIGEKVPIINASFSPVSLNPAISKLIGNDTFIQPFPSFTYEDVGLDAKMTPQIAPNGAMRLQMDLTVSGLTGVSNNSIPIISQRHVQTAVNLRNGVPVLVAGLFSSQEMRTLAGLPGISLIPGLGRLFSTQNLQTERDQLALLITPELVQLPRTHSAAVWLPASFASTTALRALPPLPRPPVAAPVAPPAPRRQPRRIVRPGTTIGGGGNGGGGT